MSGLDVNRMSEAVSRPGIDPRLWVSLAIVTEVFVDADHGHFVQVLCVPSQAVHPARVGTLYSGNGFGLYLPLEVDDEVVVVAPDGDPAAGLVVIPRLWSGGDPPPEEAATKPTDLLLLAKAGATVRIATAGDGDVVIEARGSGVVKLGGESGLSDAARNGDSIEVTLSTLQSSLDARYVTLGGSPPLVLPVTGNITSGSEKVKVK